jgi:hypothetical protein
MRHLIGDDGDGMSGFGDVAEVHEGPDGNLYEWVEGLSAWGEPVGYWQGLSELPVQPPAAQPALGALYQASDGTFYQMHGLGEEEPEPNASADAPPADADGDEAASPAKMKMGPGKPGETRLGPDGRRYRWVMGMGPGGKRTGFWRRLRPRPQRPGPPARRPAPAGARRPAAHAAAGGQRRKKPFLKRLLPLAKVAASLIPVPGAGQIIKGGLTLADKAFSRKQVAGVAGLGALYQAPDGSLYQVQGIDEDALNGFAESDAIAGFSSDADLDGLAREEIDGIDDGDEMDGWGEPTAPPIEGDEGLDGYVREPQRPTLQAYEPEKPAQTRTFDPTREPPDNWKPIW